MRLRGTGRNLEGRGYPPIPLDSWPNMSSALVPLLSATLFLNATLLFSVQPMFGKMILPLLGGTPTVWNTAMLFYQVALLLGYGYAHLSSRWLRPSTSPGPCQCRMPISGPRSSLSR